MSKQITIMNVNYNNYTDTKEIQEIISLNNNITASLLDGADILVITEIWASEVNRLKEEIDSQLFQVYFPCALENRTTSRQLTTMMVIKKDLSTKLQIQSIPADILLRNEIYNPKTKKYEPFAVNRNINLQSGLIDLTALYLPPTSKNWLERNDVRKKMLCDLFQDMNNKLNNSKKIVLYAGDFNFYPNNTPGFQEIEKLFNELPQETNAWNFIDPSSEKGSWNDNKLDYIFTNQKIINCYTRKLDMSLDHLALVVTIEINLK